MVTITSRAAIAILLMAGTWLRADPVTRTYRIRNTDAAPRTLTISAPGAHISAAGLSGPTAAGAGAAPETFTCVLEGNASKSFRVTADSTLGHVYIGLAQTGAPVSAQPSRTYGLPFAGVDSGAPGLAYRVTPQGTVEADPEAATGEPAEEDSDSARSMGSSPGPSPAWPTLPSRTVPRRPEADSDSARSMGSSAIPSAAWPTLPGHASRSPSTAGKRPRGAEEAAAASGEDRSVAARGAGAPSRPAQAAGSPTASQRKRENRDFRRALVQHVQAIIDTLGADPSKIVQTGTPTGKIQEHPIWASLDTPEKRARWMADYKENIKSASFPEVRRAPALFPSPAAAAPSAAAPGG